MENNKIKLTKRVLNNKAKPVVFDKPMQLQKLGVRMIQFMVEHKGIGLAGPQIGISKRLFVMASKDFQSVFKVFFNPVITESSEEINSDTEGCLSFPGIHLEIKRATTIKIKYYDHFGNEFTETLTEHTARCFQHELDHLDGINFQERTNNV
tara:strand:- start:803 stop:1258 length:456 start_codon:yes stop_codon:yes gene_type:complete